MGAPNTVADMRMKALAATREDLTFMARLLAERTGRWRDSGFRDREAGGLPGLDPAIEMGNAAVPELTEGVGAESRAAPRGAVEDDPAIGLELGAMVRGGGIGVELEHAAWSVDRAGDGAAGGAFFRLAEVHQHGIPGLRFLLDGFRGEVIDVLASFSNHAGDSFSGHWVVSFER
jgi:hypothetical protein